MSPLTFDSMVMDENLNVRDRRGSSKGSKTAVAVQVFGAIGSGRVTIRIVEVRLSQLRKPRLGTEMMQRVVATAVPIECAST